MPYRHIIICGESAPGNSGKKSHAKRIRRRDEGIRKIMWIFWNDQVHGLRNERYIYRVKSFYQCPCKFFNKFFMDDLQKVNPYVVQHYWSLYNNFGVKHLLL